MLEKSRCDCGKVVSVTNEGMIQRHWHGGKPCGGSGKYADSIVGKTRETPYLHPEPRLVGEVAVQPDQQRRYTPERFRKRNWTSYNCCECGEQGWIKASRLISIVKRGVYTIETLRCADCRGGRYQESVDAILEARKNLARRKLSMREK